MIKGKKMFKNNCWLYGEDVKVPTIPEEVADKRIELLHEHLERLLEVGYTDRDNMRINEIIKAKKFWNQLKTNEGI